MPVRIGPKNPRRIYLRQWRDHHRLTQQQVADRIGCTKYIISKWETGARTPSLEAYAEAIGEPVEKLYTMPPPPEPRRTPEPSSGLPSDFRVIVAEVVAEVLRRRNIRR